MDCVVLYQGVDGGFFKHGWYDLEHVVGRDGKRWRERERHLQKLSYYTFLDVKDLI